MANISYAIKQNICSDHDMSSPLTIKAETVSYNSNYDGDKTQQIILRPYDKDNVVTSFKAKQCYYIRINMPQNQNYDLHYGIRLMQLNFDNIETGGISLKDSNDYQFVRYISIPRLNPNNINNSIVWLYSLDGGEIINAAVAKPLNEFNNMTNDERANKIFYGNEQINICNDSGEKQSYDGSENVYSKISYLETKMANNFQTKDSSLIDREFIIVPEQDCNAIYLYLRPISDDSFITWEDDEQGTMMGRYIKDISKIVGNYANITRNEAEGLSNITNVAIWGRSEQLIVINGQELKIGPSGYYELKNYQIESLYIINSTEDDKYTVDIQYQNI